MNNGDKYYFPLDIRDVEPEDNKKLIKYFVGNTDGYIRIGPEGYVLPKSYKKEAAAIYNMEIRPDDVFVMTYPRSGTTWTQELVWLVANDMDFHKARALPLDSRFKIIESNCIVESGLSSVDTSRMSPEALMVIDSLKNSVKMVFSTPSPRFIKSHLPLSLLPPRLLDTARVIYVARDPRDVAVSFYHHNRLYKVVGYIGDFKQYWKFFIQDLILYTPFFGCVKEAWAKKDHPNMLFLFYEEILKDLPETIRRVSKFLGKTVSESEMEQLCDHLSFHNFKKNESVNREPMKYLLPEFIAPEGGDFIRKGKAGGWRDYFDAEMTEQAERWIQDNLRDTDLRFPEQ